MNPYCFCESWYSIMMSLHACIGVCLHFTYSFYSLKEHRVYASALSVMSVGAPETGDNRYSIGM